jgi:hypothetical protein
MLKQRRWKIWIECANRKKEKSMKEHLQLLGYKVKDRVTGFTGVATCVSFDLYGCVQVIVTPEPDKEGKMVDSHWFDEKRLRKVGKEPVMEIPTFEIIPGGQKLPRPSTLPKL